ncbi:hypothetical protein JOY44_01860 [Phormidium sp. CLA17]|uniref:hypothetical protein n=1 Tax=Leptolyngbya sp. Cla-17 TaxID=2803751 RepID=UPI001491BF03|nr:hypothetical protein [Leptolyngbya sp. Cla-17]MBM0740372.1 hypothetical protein [Leptolyngbya sp. Cla-17]
MLTLITGWLRELGSVVGFSSSTNYKSSNQFVEVDRISPSKFGYKTEHDEIKRLMTRLSGFETVEFTDTNGNPMNITTVDQRYGRDGGIDCVIRIVAPTERGASNVAGRIRNIIIKGNY